MAKMFVLVRKIHLYSAFVIAAFLLMYFITGIVLIMENNFPRKNVKEVSEKIFFNHAEAEEVTLAHLCKKYEIHGHERKTLQGNGITYSYFKPGYRAEIIFTANEDSVLLKIKKGSFGVLMSDFHRLRGFDSIIHILWGVFYDLSCLALIVFAFTGLYLWLKIEKQKLIGIIFLLTSTVVTAFTVWYLMTVC